MEPPVSDVNGRGDTSVVTDKLRRIKWTERREKDDGKLKLEEKRRKELKKRSVVKCMYVWRGENQN